MAEAEPPRDGGATDVRAVRSFVDERPELREALVGDVEHWLASSWESLPRTVPVPPAVTPFVARPFFRPPFSHRAFYFWPGMPGDGGSPRGGRAVLAWKGLEPCASDFPALLERLRRPCYTPHSMAEHLVVEEHKVPGCVALSEAVREGERAAELQSAHLRSYGGLARLPLPLFAFRHADETVRRVTDLLRAHLAAPVFEQVRPKLEAGLGAYVYYYPTPPMRVRDLDIALPPVGFAERAVAVRSLCDVDRTVRRWVSSLVRMLYLGYVPATLSSLRTGTCCQPQNACLDGGFVDLDSVTPLSDLRDETAVAAGLHFTMESLVRTLRTLTAGSADRAARERTENRVDLHYVTQHLLSLFREAIPAEARPSLTLDPRVARYFTPAGTAADLFDRLATYHAGPADVFDGAARTFSEIGAAVLAAAREG